MYRGVRALAAVVILCPALLLGQAPDTTWTRKYGGTAADAGQTGLQTFDGGYVFVGTTWSFGAGNADIWLLKLSAQGDTEWTRTYGGTAGDHGFGVIQMRDSGYAIAGWTNSFGITDTDAYVVRTDPRGETLWTRTFGGTGHDRAWTVAELFDGGVAITGWSHSYSGLPYGHVFVARAAADGDSVWVRVYGGEYSDFGISIQQTMDTCLVIAGYYGTGPGLRVDGYFLKLNMNGDTIWTRRYGGSSNDGMSWVEQTSDTGYILSGASYSYGAGMACVWLIKTGPDGILQWMKEYGWPRDDGARGGKQTSDGGYVVVGQCDAQGWESSDIWFLKLNAAGDSEWTWMYGQPDSWDKAFIAQETRDGGYVLFGETESYDARNRDFFVAKFEPPTGVAGQTPARPVSGGAPTIVSARSFGPVLLLDASGRARQFGPGAQPGPGVYWPLDRTRPRQRILVAK